jgi:hypothetical protein
MDVIKLTERLKALLSKELALAVNPSLWEDADEKFPDDPDLAKERNIFYCPRFEAESSDDEIEQQLHEAVTAIGRARGDLSRLEMAGFKDDGGAILMTIVAPGKEAPPLVEHGRVRLQYERKDQPGYSR